MNMETKFVTLNPDSRKISYVISGKGPVVLGISGFGCDHYNFEELHKDLSKEFTLITPDNRGMGESFKPEGQYELEDIATDTLQLMDSLGINEFHLIGISMGGFVSQLLTLMAPTRVKSLTLLCTTSGGERFISLPKMSEEGLRKFHEVAEPERSTLAIGQIVHPSLALTDPERFAAIAKLRRDHPADIEQIIFQKHAVDRFLAKDLPLNEIACPTLVLTGAQDRFVSPENARILSEHIKEANLYSVSGSDHLFFLERPREVGELILPFLKGLV